MEAIEHDALTAYALALTTKAFDQTRSQEERDEYTQQALDVLTKLTLSQE
jgi:hypothetical protein